MENSLCRIHVNWNHWKCIAQKRWPIRYRRKTVSSSEKFHPASYIREVRYEDSSIPCLMNNDQIIILEQIKLYVGIEELGVNSVLNVVETCSLNLPNGTDLMGSYVTSICSTQRRLRPLRSRPTAILLTGACEKVFIAIASFQEGNGHLDGSYIQESESMIIVKLRAAKQTLVKTDIMKRALVIKTWQRLMYYKEDEQLDRRRQLLCAKEVTEFLSEWSV